MADYPSIERLAQLQQMIADFSEVKRMPHMADKGRPENDVEHSFGLAITCWFLQPKIAPELEISRILRYALAHDIVEIHAGDTFAFGQDKAYIASKETRERDAIKKLRSDLQDFTELVDFAERYMDKVDEEAKFVKAVDKILPLIMIDLGEGRAYWRRHKINTSKLRKNKEPIFVSDIVAPYYEMLFEWLDKNGNLPKD
jgi:putative hydrolase of HD superfamily